MTVKTDAELIQEKHRDADRIALADSYMQQAIEASRLRDLETDEPEYGFLNIRGHEVPDPTVIEPPLGYVQQPDLMEQMRRMVRGAMSEIADAQEFETFEEADDFDIDDDPVDYTSPYELYFDPAPGSDAGPPTPPTHPARADPNAPLSGEVIPPEAPAPQDPAGSPQKPA